MVIYFTQILAKCQLLQSVARKKKSQLLVTNGPPPHHPTKKKSSLRDKKTWKAKKGGLIWKLCLLYLQYTARSHKQCGIALYTMNIGNRFPLI